MRLNHLGTDMSPGRLMYEQDMNRLRARPAPITSTQGPPSSLLQTIRARLPRVAQHEEDSLPEYRSSAAPLPLQPALLRDPIAPPPPDVEEEIAWWGDKVVWSKGASVFRTFTYGHEKEEVRFAMFAWFPEGSEGMETDASADKGEGSSSRRREKGLHPTAPPLGEVGGQPAPNAFGPFATSFGATWQAKRSVQAGGGSARDHPFSRLQRCLAVFLETTAFFYFASGETRVTSLPRPVEEAWSLKEGGIMVRLKATPGKGGLSGSKGKGRAEDMYANEMDESTIAGTPEDRQPVRRLGRICTLTVPGDQFRPVLVNPSLELTPIGTETGFTVQDGETISLQPIPSSSTLIYVSDEALGILVCQDTKTNEVVFYRFGRRGISPLLDEWHDESLAAVPPSLPDPLDRGARSQGGQDRRSSGPGLRNARTSLAGNGRQRGSISAPRPDRRTSLLQRPGNVQHAGASPRNLANAVGSDEMDQTMIAGTTAQRSQVAPAFTCQELTRWGPGARSAPLGTLHVFISGDPALRDYRLNIHMYAPTGRLLRFPLWITRSDKAPGELVRHQIGEYSLVSCLAAHAVSARPGFGVEILIQSSTFPRRLCLLDSNDEDADTFELPPAVEAGAVNLGGSPNTNGAQNSERKELLRFGGNRDTNAFSITPAGKTPARCHRFEIEPPAKTRLLHQVYLAVNLYLSAGDARAVQAIIESSPARTSLQSADILQEIVQFAIGNSPSLTPSKGDPSPFEAYLARVPEVDISRPPRLCKPASAASDLAKHSPGVFANGLLRMLHWIGQDCIVDTSRQGDISLILPEIGRLALHLQLPNWTDYWWRLYPELIARSADCREPVVAPTQAGMVDPPDLLADLSELIHGGRAEVVISLDKHLRAHPASAAVLAIGVSLAQDGSGGPSCTRALRMTRLLAEQPGLRQRICTLPWALRVPILEALRATREQAASSESEKVLLIAQRFDLLAQQRRKNRLVVLDQREPPQRDILLEEDRGAIASARQAVQSSNPDLAETQEPLRGYEHAEPTTPLPGIRFVVDRRLDDIQRLLQTHRPRTIKADTRSDLTGDQRVEHEEKIVVHHAQRVLSRLIGKGILTYGSKDIAFHGTLQLPSLELAVRIMPTLDLRLPAYSKLQADVPGWPTFHNGVIEGLTVKPTSPNIDHSWIAAHRRVLPLAEFGGLLLGLGLNGHLKALLKDNILEWLAPRNDQASVGLILGVAASFAGSRSKAITSTLAANLPCLLPGGSLELNTSPIVQAAAFMGIGLLHAASSDHSLASVALNEIGRQLLPGIEPLAECREAYAFSAACAFGLVMLGRGGANAVMDAHCVPRLRAFCDSSLAVGGGGGFADDIDHDVTAPGATLALGLMFLRTGRSDISALLTPPENVFALDQIRPDLLIVRTLSRALIHWDNIEASTAWIEAQIPPFILLAWNDRSREKPKDTVEIAYIHIMTGACLALGMRFAGTLNDFVYRTLHSQVKAFADNHGGTTSYEARIRRAALKQAQALIAIALGFVVAGSGDLTAYRRIRFLLGTEAGNFAWRTAMNMAAGLFFMGTGRYTFGSSNMAIAAMCIACFPRFAAQPDHNFAYLQAYRHFWALAVEPRCVNTGDIDALTTVYVPLKVESKQGMQPKQRNVVSPALLTTFDSITSVSVGSPRYHQATVPLGQNPSSNGLIKSQVMFVKRKSAYVDYTADPKGHRTLNMLAGPLFNNAVDGIVGEFGGATAVSPDVRDVTALVAEHTEDPFFNGLVRRLIQPEMLAVVENWQGKNAATSYTWPSMALRSLLMDRVDLLGLEFAMTMSTDCTSRGSGMLNMRLAHFARDYYEQEAARQRSSSERTKAPDTLIRLSSIEFLLKADRSTEWVPGFSDMAAKAYFLSIGSEFDGVVPNETVELDPRYLALNNVPSYGVLRKLRTALTGAESRLQSYPDSTRSAGHKVHTLRWLARKKMMDNDKGRSVPPGAKTTADGQLRVAASHWSDMSLTTAISAWFP